MSPRLAMSENIGHPPEELESLAHLRAIIIALFVIFMYWIKELMEFALRKIFGVDHRLIFVPIPQNTRVDTTILGMSRLYQRGEIFYSLFHFIMSVCLALLFFFLALNTEFPEKIPGSIF